MLSSSDSEPALHPPAGVTSKLVDPPSQAHIIILITTIVLCLSTPVVLVRLYTRQFVNRKLWWDDGATFRPHTSVLWSVC